MTIGFMCVAILGLGTFGYVEAKYLFAKLDKVSHTDAPALRIMENTDMLHDNIKANVFSALYHFSQSDMNGLTESKNDNLEAEKNISENMAKLSKLDLSAKTKEAIRVSSAEISDYLNLSNGLIQKLILKNQSGVVNEVLKFEEKFKALEKNLEILNSSVEADTVQVADSAEFVLNLFLFAAIAIFSLGLAVGYYTVRRLTLNLKKYTAELDQSSNLVKSISENLSASNVQLSSSATEAAASLEETVASLEELSSMISLNTENSKKAFQISEQAQVAAETGDKNIRDLSAAMLTIKNDSKKMEDIVNVIDDISFQTNLLALNAAVEAARAGEQGKGFAVVADAVRSLAQRSSASAKEINQMIKDSVSKIESGSALANDCNQSLKNIFEHVKNVTQLSGQIAQASAEQTTGLKQINQAMIQLDSASQENASTAEEVSRSATEANHQSDNMNHVVGELTEFIFGQGNAATPVKEYLKPSSPVSKSKTNFKSNVVSMPKYKNKKATLDLGPEPQNTDIKKVENF